MRLVFQKTCITYKKNKVKNVHILASMHLITLVIEVGELSTGSKVKGDFLLNVPVDKIQIVKTKKTLTALLTEKPLNIYFLSTYVI